MGQRAASALVLAVLGISLKSQRLSEQVAESSDSIFPGDQHRFSAEPVRDLAFYARRVPLSGAIIAGHVLLLLCVLSLGWTVHPPVAERRLTVIEVSAAQVPSTPARPTTTPQVAPVQQVELLPSALPLLAAASGGGEATGCAMTMVVARAIAANPEAMAALAALPPDLRTEADAVMLWNGTWLPIDEPPVVSLTPPEDLLGPLKQVVIEALAATPVECRDADTIGPQFIPIQEPGRTTMLVVGSGVWRWSSVVEPAMDVVPSSPSFQPAKLSLFAPTPTGN